jgi:hypothetical protein
VVSVIGFFPLFVAFMSHPCRTGLPCPIRKWRFPWVCWGLAGEGDWLKKSAPKEALVLDFKGFQGASD